MIYKEYNNTKKEDDFKNFALMLSEPLVQVVIVINELIKGTSNAKN